MAELVPHKTSGPVADLHSKILEVCPPGVQILSISCSFWENLAPPPRGNPGSAAAGYSIMERIEFWSDEIEIMYFGRAEIVIYNLFYASTSKMSSYFLLAAYLNSFFNYCNVKNKITLESTFNVIVIFNYNLMELKHD